MSAGEFSRAEKFTAVTRRINLKRQSNSPRAGKSNIGGRLSKQRARWRKRHRLRNDRTRKLARSLSRGFPKHPLFALCACETMLDKGNGFGAVSSRIYWLQFEMMADDEQDERRRPAERTCTCVLTYVRSFHLENPLFYRNDHNHLVDGEFSIPACVKKHVKDIGDFDTFERT